VDFPGVSNSCSMGTCGSVDSPKGRFHFSRLLNSRLGNRSFEALPIPTFMQPTASHPARVLIVDDDSILATLYRIMLQNAGYQVEVADSGESGLFKISLSQPDLVVLDLMLGDMNGVEVLKVLRGNPATKKLPVIVFSSVFLGGLVEEAKAAGATKYLHKTSCSPSRLIDEIQVLLEPEGATQLSRQFVMSGGRPAARQSSGSRILAAPPPVKPRLPRPLGTTPLSERQPPEPAALPLSDEVPADTRRELLQQVRARIDDAVAALPNWVKNPENTEAPYLGALYRAVRSIAGSASLAGRLRLGHVAGVLEALLLDIKQSKGEKSETVHHSVAEAVGLLPVLFGNGEPGVESLPTPLVIVVDDDRKIRAQIDAALRNAQLRAICAADAAVATRLFECNKFDLAIIDLQIPGSGGLDLASGLREGSSVGDAPVVFISETQEAAAKVPNVDGKRIDVIVHPIQPLELAMASLIKIYR
jgi:two-component system cell cycle response regulator DivK